VPAGAGPDAVLVDGDVDNNDRWTASLEFAEKCRASARR